MNLAFETVNLEYKKIIVPLKIRSVPIDEWIQHAVKTESLNYGEKIWREEAISKGLKGHQDVKCFNCDKSGHLRRSCRQGVPINNVSSRDDPSRRSQPSGLCKRCGKDQHWTNKGRSKRDKQGNILPIENALGGSSDRLPC